MRKITPPSDERPGFVTRLAIAALAFLASILLGAIAAAAPAEAECPDCGSDPVDYYSVLTVTRPAIGTITSNAVGGNQINCPATGGGTCSVTDEQTAFDNRPTTGWPTYTLTATGANGYTLFWSGICNNTATPCAVRNSQQTTTVTTSALDTQAPTTPTLSAGDFVDGGTALTAASTDNVGPIAYNWTACNATQCVPFSFHGASVTLGSLWQDTWSVHVRAVDAAGNWSAEAVKTVVLDKTLPQVHVTGPDMYATLHGPHTQISFTATDDNLASVECTVNGSQPESCSTGWDASNLPAGQTSLIKVIATDKAGNVKDDYVFVYASPVEFTVSLNPSGFGLSSAAASGLPQQATGTVHFHTGQGVDICTAPVQGGQAFCLADPAVVTSDDHQIVADYSGDADLFAASAQVDVTPPQPFSFSVAPKPGTLGYGAKHVLVMSGAPAALTGSVTFSVGTRTLCAPAVANGGATCLLSGTSLRPGTHTITAAASGDMNYVAETKDFTVTIAKGAVHLVQSVSSTTVHKGQATRATVSGVPAGGSITFSIGTRSICTVKAVGGRASCSTPTGLAVNSYQIVAKYAGSALWRAASATTKFTVVR